MDEQAQPTARAATANAKARARLIRTSRFINKLCGPVSLHLSVPEMPRRSQCAWGSARTVLAQRAASWLALHHAVVGVRSRGLLAAADRAALEAHRATADEPPGQWRRVASPAWARGLHVQNRRA